MRTYKYILLVILMALTLSCKKEPKISITGHDIIEFQPTIQTKAYISDNEILKNNCMAGTSGGIGIIAKKTYLPTQPGEAGASTILIDNACLQWDPNSQKWNHDQENKYWGLNCQHEFLAIYPYTPKTVATDAILTKNDEYIVSTVFTRDRNTGKPTNNDILYGRDTVKYKLSYTPRKVNLNMKHALSAISVNVKNISNDAIVLIDNIQLSGLHTRANTLSFPLHINPGSEVPTINVDNGSQETYKFDNYGKKILGQSNDPHKIIQPSIIIPQDFTHGTITLSFRIHPEKGTARDIAITLSEYRVDLNDKEHAFEYISGKHYKYTLNITDSQIKCEVRIVPWITDTIILK